MSKKQSDFIQVSTGGKPYVAERTENLAKLALLKLGDVYVYPTNQGEPYDFSVHTLNGFCFFVEVKAISSIRLKIQKINEIRELRWRIPVRLLRAAKESVNPFILFLFDGDTDHGRYLRLDGIALEKRSANAQTIRLPIENTINEENLRSMINSLQSTPTD